MSDLFQKIKKESMITSIICIVFGVMFCIWPGTILVTLCRIAEVKKASSPRLWIGLLVAIATIIIGVILMLHTWLALEIGMMAVGLILIYDGISGLWLNGRAGRAYKSCHNPEDDIIDVDYKEED